MDKTNAKWILHLNVKCEVQNFLKTLEKLGLSKLGKFPSICTKSTLVLTTKMFLHKAP